MHHLYLSYQPSETSLRKEREALEGWCREGGIEDYEILEENLTSGHLWLKKQSQATVSTSAIKVYGANTVTLSFTKAKGYVKVGYSFDGTNWSEFDADTTNATSFSHDITTTAKDVVYIRFKEGNNSNALRIDDFTLTIKD